MVRGFPRGLVPDFRGLPRPFWVLFAGTLVNRTGGFVLIFLAIYLTEVRGLTPAQAGAIISAYGLGAIGGGPLGGALSDRLGRRPTLVVSLIGGGARMLVLGLVSRTATITVAAMVTGLLYEMYRPVVSATVADVVRSEDRPRAYGLIYWAAWIGSVSGYATSIAIWTLGEILFAPAVMSLVADLAPPHLRGRYQGAFAMAFTGAFAAAPAVGGYLITHAGARWLWIDCLATGLAVAAGFFVLRCVTPRDVDLAHARSPG